MRQQPVQTIAEAAKHILDTVPGDVIVLAAAKGRTVAEVEAVLETGITWVGHNYVQEARQMLTPTLRKRASWHCIGHLQRNKVNLALKLFDMIETLDSIQLARAINKRCASQGMTMPVLIEINSGVEASKTGVMPEMLDDLVDAVTSMKHIHVQGLMTMGPRFGDPEDARPYFQATRQAFERLSKHDLPNITMRYLSMGMSNSYRVAIEEGANVVRIGSALFGSELE